MTETKTDNKTTNKIRLGVEDYKKEFGEASFRDVISKLYNHSHLRSSKIPENEEQQLYYSLLTMLDFQCFIYEDKPKGITQQQTIKFLKDHKKRIKCDVPSMIGLFSGVFNFLIDEKAGENPPKIPE